MFCSSASKIAGSLYSEPCTRSERISSSHCDARGITFIARPPIADATFATALSGDFGAAFKNNPTDRSNNSTGLLGLQEHSLAAVPLVPPGPRQPQQRLQRNRDVVRGLARQAYGVKRTQDEVAQQPRIGFAGQGARALRFRHQLRPSRNVGAPKLAGRGSRSISRE